MHVRYLQHQHQGTVQLLLMPLSTAANSIKSTKWVDDNDESDCEAVPLPIQTFLWRQTKLSSENIERTAAWNALMNLYVDLSSTFFLNAE
ncbi:Unc-80p [Parelaphostrongylus tenuis]|uniref:Unc-80p n=1 Tax=Parelaphostrongylus tenuis TaxID=148309 RepID=A0AAD5MRV5_PARTN|nr:Unc-80p [Parelaphostrongylus tenuis]